MDPLAFDSLSKHRAVTEISATLRILSRISCDCKLFSYLFFFIVLDG